MQSESSALHLCILERDLALIRFGKANEVPSALWAQLQGGVDTSFLSITRTPDEISVVTDGNVAELGGNLSFWRGIKVKGPLPHTMTGVMNQLTLPLKEAKVPIFVISTWDTDYLLVPIDMLLIATESLKVNGWHFV